MDQLISWGIVAIAAVAALVLVAIARRFLVRWASRHWQPAAAIADRCGRPGQIAAVLLAVRITIDQDRLPDPIHSATTRVLDLALIGAMTWLTIQILYVAANAIADEVVQARGEKSATARRIRTQVMLLQRIVAVVGAIVGVGVMLFTFEPVRALGGALLASAGIAGVIAGVAAKETVGNLFAGIQVAFGNMLRIDDVVKVEDEWGKVEELTLTYVVVRIWDDRRLVLPVSYFTQNPFTNWTARDERITATVFLNVDWRVPVAEVRGELETYLEQHPLWDRRVGGVVVTDVLENGLVEIRATVSAKDGHDAWDLQCDVREHLVGFLRESYPDALPRHRHNVTLTEPERPE